MSVLAGFPGERQQIKRVCDHRSKAVYRRSELLAEFVQNPLHAFPMSTLQPQTCSKNWACNGAYIFGFESSTNVSKSTKKFS